MRVALGDAADRAVGLARQTQHRVMREIYEQFATYSRQYVARIGTYTAPADLLVRVAISLSETLDGICGAITYGTAGARSPLVPPAAPTPGLSPAGDPNFPQLFLDSSNPACPQWLKWVDQFSLDTTVWRNIDPNIPSTHFDDSQRAINAAVMPVMEAFATETQLVGRSSDNPIWTDLSTLSAQYRRAYVSALSTYVVADDYLQLAAGSAAGAISSACRAVGQ